MGDLVNLNRFKKRVAKDKSAQHADEQRARFGRTKAERALQDANDRKRNSVLDQHRMGEDEA